MSEHRTFADVTAHIKDLQRQRQRKQDVLPFISSEIEARLSRSSTETAMRLSGMKGRKIEEIREIQHEIDKLTRELTHLATTVPGSHPLRHIIQDETGETGEPQIQISFQVDADGKSFHTNRFVESVELAHDDSVSSPTVVIFEDPALAPKILLPPLKAGIHVRHRFLSAENPDAPLSHPVFIAAESSPITPHLVRATSAQ